MNKVVFANFAKLTGKHLWFGKFSKKPFLQNTPGRLLLAFSCNVTRMGYCQRCLEKLGWILPRNTNLRSTVHVYHFFLGSINFQCMFSLVYTVYCQKMPPEYRCSVRKGTLKNFVKFIGKHLCWSRILIKLQVWQLFWRNLPTTAFTLHSHHLLLLIRFTHLPPHQC